MTQRDQKTLMILVLSVVGAGMGFFLLQSWFLGPYGEYTRQIESLTGEVDSKEQQLAGIIRDIPLLKEARKHSVAANPVRAVEDYDEYLKRLCNASGLKNVDINPASLPADPKSGPGVPVSPNAAKKPGHIVLKYTVHAKGSLAAVVAAFDNLQRTPVLHRVVYWRLSRQESASANKDNAKDQLTVELQMEAMIAAGTEANLVASLKPDTSMRLPTPSNPRRYNDIARKNIFVGFVEKEIVEYDDPLKQVIPEHVRLSQTDPTSQEAFLRNLIFQMRETRLRSDPRSGFKKFQIRSEDGSEVLIDATVLRIDQRDVYFQVKEDIYGIHLNDTVAHAMRRPLSDAELKNLGLTSLILEYDPKTDAARKDSKKGGRGGKKKG
jgi:hypothetical protein